MTEVVNSEYLRWSGLLMKSFHRGMIGGWLTTGLRWKSLWSNTAFPRTGLSQASYTRSKSFCKHCHAFNDLISVAQTTLCVPSFSLYKSGVFARKQQIPVCNYLPHDALLRNLVSVLPVGGPPPRHQTNQRRKFLQMSKMPRKRKSCNQLRLPMCDFCHAKGLKESTAVYFCSPCRIFHFWSIKPL